MGAAVCPLSCGPVHITACGGRARGARVSLCEAKLALRHHIIGIPSRAAVTAHTAPPTRPPHTLVRVTHVHEKNPAGAGARAHGARAGSHTQAHRTHNSPRMLRPNLAAAQDLHLRGATVASVARVRARQGATQGVHARGHVGHRRGGVRARTGERRARVCAPGSALPRVVPPGPPCCALQPGNAALSLAPTNRFEFSRVGQARAKF